MVGERYPLRGLALRFLHPVDYDFSGASLWAVRALDYLGWIAVVFLIVAGIRRAIRRDPGPLECASALLGLAALAISNYPFWEGPASYTRVFASLMALSAMEAIRRNAWQFALALLLLDLRLGLRFGPQLAGVWRAIFPG
jgi:hypothetical protein